MKRVSLVGAPSGGPQSRLDWIESAVRQLADASQQDDLVGLAQSYTIIGAFTTTRSLNVSTATTADIIAFIATFITDLKKGAINRTA